MDDALSHALPCSVALVCPSTRAEQDELRRAFASVALVTPLAPPSLLAAPQAPPQLAKLLATMAAAPPRLQTLQLHVEEELGIATVLLNRPRAANSLTSEMLDELVTAFGELLDILTGAPEEVTKNPQGSAATGSASSAGVTHPASPGKAKK